VPIGIGLDHPHDPGVFTHNRFNLMEIMGESGKLNLQPVHSLELPVAQKSLKFSFYQGIYQGKNGATKSFDITPYIL
jgi:hypothetical protein